MERRRWGIVGGVIMYLVGLPGFIDDGRTWLEWFTTLTSAPWQWWNYALAFLATTTTLYAVAPQRVVNGMGRIFSVRFYPTYPDKEEVLRMMRGVAEFVATRKEEKLRSTLIPHPAPSPRELSESLKQARRVGIWQRKLKGKGLYPLKPENPDLTDWQVYLEFLIPVVEEYEIKRALEETRKMYREATP